MQLVQALLERWEVHVLIWQDWDFRHCSTPDKAHIRSRLSPFLPQPSAVFSYASKASSFATRVQNQFRKPAKLASSKVQMIHQLDIPNAGSKGDQPLQAWRRQPDLLEGSSSPIFGSLLSDCGCVPWVLEKAVCFHSSAVFFRATTCWLQK